MSTRFSKPLASAKMKKITTILSYTTKRRFMASSPVCACRFISFIDHDDTSTLSSFISQLFSQMNFVIP